MLLPSLVALITVLAVGVLSAPPGPSLKSVERYSGPTTGKYIVKVKDGVSRKQLIRKLRLASAAEWNLINGFSGSFNDDALTALRSSDDVEYITEDGLVYAVASVNQTDAPWGLQRITQVERVLTFDGDLGYSFPHDSSAGSGVDIYVADTGVLVTHSQFGGRASSGANFVTNTTTLDRNGHGTHCAGTAGGSQFGVAKNASLISVKVLGDYGSGTFEGLISGLDWIAQQVAISGRPSVVSMSIGASANTPLDDAVNRLTLSGVHVVVAAGNENRDASTRSPARVASAITVGAITIQDSRSSFSNYGPVVDVYAPGSSVISAWVGSDTATNNISGTSMATPHVAGIVATLIARHGNVSPAEMEAKLKGLAVKGAITGLPVGTENNLAYLTPVVSQSDLV